jgi:hypothetical protein
MYRMIRRIRRILDTHVQTFIRSAPYETRAEAYPETIPACHLSLVNPDDPTTQRPDL